MTTFVKPLTTPLAERILRQYASPTAAPEFASRDDFFRDPTLMGFGVRLRWHQGLLHEARKRPCERCRIAAGKLETDL